MNFFKLVTALMLSTILTTQGICYAGKPQGCFEAKKYKAKQIYNEKQFLKKYLSTGLEFMVSPFFLKQVVYIPFTELSKIVDSPRVRAYFYSINYGHINAFKDNPLALVKFIVDNQLIYEPIVRSYLNASPNLVDKKNYDSRLNRLVTDLKTLLMGKQILISNQVPVPEPSENQIPVAIPESNDNQVAVEIPEPSDNQVPFFSTSELITDPSEVNINSLLWWL